MCALLLSEVSSVRRGVQVFIRDSVLPLLERGDSVCCQSEAKTRVMMAPRWELHIYDGSHKLCSCVYSKTAAGKTDPNTDSKYCLIESEEG